MQALGDFVLRLTSADRVGGRVQRVGRDRVELLDCMSWTWGCTERVQREFPEVVVNIRSCRHSLSGFAVVFVWKGGGVFESMWYLAIAVGLTSCAYALFTSPWWWGAYRLIRGI
jgi:hypothetical protein